MSWGNTFEQCGLRQAGPGLTPFDSLDVDPLRHTQISVSKGVLDAHTSQAQRLAVSGEVFPPGNYRLLPGFGVVPQGGVIPERFMQVDAPFNVHLRHGFHWSAPKGPVALPITAGLLKLPVAAEDSLDTAQWRVFGDERDGSLRLHLDLGAQRADLVIPQFNIRPPEKNPARTIFDMAQRAKPPTKPPAVPTAIEAQPKTPSKPTLKADRLKRKPRSTILPPRQKSFEFSSSTPKAVISASLAIEQPNVEIDATNNVYQPKAGDTGQVPLERKAARNGFFQGHLDFRGARREERFWEPPSYVADFWNTVIDGKKPFKKITVVFHDTNHGTLYFIPKNKPTLRVGGYPNGASTDEYPDPELFDRGCVLANQTCFIPLAGSSHEGIVYPVNGSCDIWVTVPNHAGEYDFGEGKNRGPIPAGSAVTRREDRLLCEFDPLEDPNTPYATYRLFAPGSRGTVVSRLDPKEAQKQFMNHYYRKEERKRGNQARLKRAGTVFSVRV